MSFRLVYEAVVAFTLVFFATAFAVTWKDCGEITRSRFSFTSGIAGGQTYFSSTPAFTEVIISQPV